jgi:hypothetical protein
LSEHSLVEGELHEAPIKREPFGCNRLIAGQRLR